MYSSLTGGSSKSTSRMVVIGIFHPWNHNIIRISQFASMSLSVMTNVQPKLVDDDLRRRWLIQSVVFFCGAQYMSLNSRSSKWKGTYNNSLCVCFLISHKDRVVRNLEFVSMSKTKYVSRNRRGSVEVSLPS